MKDVGSQPASPSRMGDDSPAIAAVADGLARAIHELRLQPGAKLGAEEIGEIYGVSRTVVRAALQSLAHERLVEIRRHRGAFVSSPDRREAAEVFEARALLEPRTARSAGERAGPADVDLLRRHIEMEHGALDAGDAGRALRLSGQFHVELARIADQHTIARFIEALVARSSLAIALYARRSSARCERHAHDALIEAVASNDGPAAEDLMRSHLVDLHSMLDLRASPETPRGLREALLGD